MRFLDISNITEQKSNAQQVERRCVCNILHAYWDFFVQQAGFVIAIGSVQL